MKMQEIVDSAHVICPGLQVTLDEPTATAELLCTREQAPGLCDWLFNEQKYHFAGLVVEESTQWDLRYLFVGDAGMGRVFVRTHAPLDEARFRTVGLSVHAADWHEREAEDLFGLAFEGHPQLGDFILHDDAWQEGVAPMRRAFRAEVAISERAPREDWRPRRVVDIPGAFVMPIGPVFAGHAESVHFQLETIGEEVLRAFPRLFFKYRGVEKQAEGRSVSEALLLAERFAGTTAFSHALAYCHAVEQLWDARVPQRAAALRVFFAELERFRNHLGTIAAVCSSTGLAVGASQSAMLEEEALRLTGALAGHRYLFGLTRPGGLSRDFEQSDLERCVSRAENIVRRLEKVEALLSHTSSFLDRLEDVGVVTQEQARAYGLVGPVARASGYCADLRKSGACAAYESYDFTSPREGEGDGYARLRVFFFEAKQSVRIMKQVAENLPDGPVSSRYRAEAGAALAGVESPRGAAWHWVRLDEDGKLSRYHLATPSFANWHGFHLAAEDFAFQDFPIILATFGLSVAENDR